MGEAADLQVSYAATMRLLLVAALLTLGATGCKGQRCNAARAEALAPWQNLQRAVDQRVAEERAAVATDAGTTERDEERLEHARHRLEQAMYWSQRVQVGVMLLEAKRRETFVPTFDQTIREVSESVHGVNDPQLNAELGPARLAALNALAACR